MLRLEPVFKALLRPYIQLLNLKSVVVILESETFHGKLIVSTREAKGDILHNLSFQSERSQGCIEFPLEHDSEIYVPLTIDGRQVGYAHMEPKESLEEFTQEQRLVLTLTIPMLSAVVDISELYLGLQEINKRLLWHLGKLNASLGKEQKLFYQELIQAREEERGRMAADLHDGPLQKVLNLIQKIESHKYETNEIEILALQVASELREIASHLHLPILDDLGLVPALEWLICDMTRGINLDVSLVLTGFSDEERLPPGIELVLFRVTEESIRNAIKHSQCSSIEVHLLRTDSHITLEVNDNGRGFLSDFRGSGLYSFGLSSMKTRIRQLRGSISVTSTCKQGTTIIAHIPLV